MTDTNHQMLVFDSHEALEEATQLLTKAQINHRVEHTHKRMLGDEIKFFL